MKLGFYPGCSLLGSSREYGESFRAIAPRLGLDLQEVPDWNCCGASAAHNLNRELSLALPARVLALAEQAGLTEVVAPCSACYSRLAVTNHELVKDEKLRKRVCEIAEVTYQGTVKVVNVLEVLARVAANGLASKIVAPFKHKVACYYGCYLVRPAEITKCDRPEDPQAMDELMKLLGAEPIDWAFKVECCGAGFSVSRTDLVAKLSGKILNDAVRRGAGAIIVACPMCQVNLDLRRDAITGYLGREHTIPVLYISQAIGLALGIDEQSLGLHRHIVPVSLSVSENTTAEPARVERVETPGKPE
jgi:heterodisulfide reductase subunit B